MTTPLTQTTGRRKEAVARVRLAPRHRHDHHQQPRLRQLLHLGHAPPDGDGAAAPDRRPQQTYDIDATIEGGGVAGQAGALRLGIARSLLELDEDVRPTLKKAGLLTRDARKKETKKYGLKKARKAPQYSKR